MLQPSLIKVKAFFMSIFVGANPLLVGKKTQAPVVHIILAAR
jgi:hypothetical protein